MHPKGLETEGCRLGPDLVCRQESVSEDVLFFSQGGKDTYGKRGRRDRGRSSIADGLTGSGRALDEAGEIPEVQEKPHSSCCALKDQTGAHVEWGDVWQSARWEMMVASMTGWGQQWIRKVNLRHI